MGAACHQNRDRIRLETGNQQSVDNHRQHIRKVGAAGRVGNHDHGAAATGRGLDQRPAIDGKIHGAGEQPSDIAGAAGRRGLERTNPQPTKIDGHAVAPVWKFDDHGDQDTIGVRFTSGIG